MKKQLLNLSFVAAAFALYVTAIAAPIAPVNTMVIPSVAPDAAPALDGVAEDVYSAVNSTDWGYPDQQTAYGGETDFKAEFQVCWNKDGLYMFVNISDDVEHNYTWDYSSEWMFDNFEVFLQLDTNTVSTSYDSTTVQLRVNRGLDSVQSAGRAARADYGYYMEAQAAGGWLAEVLIPWTSVLAASMVPEDIMDYVGPAVGFDFAGADSDNTDGDETVGNRDYQTFWDLDGQDGTEDLAWNNTSTFGYVELAELPVSIESTSATSITAYPNPAESTVTFDVEGQVSIEIFSITGVKVMESSVNTVDVSGLNSGLYVAVINNESIRFTVK